jgi:hypothetical protein
MEAIGSFKTRLVLTERTASSAQNTVLLLNKHYFSRKPKLIMLISKPSTDNDREPN